MKATYNWLKDFVEIKISPQALAEKLTMAGLEVVSLEAKEKDFVFEIETTSNRPDWLSVIGIAREVAAITGEKLKWSGVTLPAGRQASNKSRTSGQRSFVIKVEDQKDCPLYTVKLIKNAKVASSPRWLAQRLESMGCRPVNNIVDITNYVLFEWGEPLHAFDFDKLRDNSIIVRRARDRERIVTIDGQERQLTPDILVIADAQRPVAVAGVMGSQASEVSLNSKHVLLEAAIFNPGLIRRGRQRLGMQSEASYRFERGVNPEIVELASLRAKQLIQEIAAGECVLEKSLGGPKPKRKSILLNAPDVEKISGLVIPKPEIKTILGRLGFILRSKGRDKFLIQVPFWRQDVVLAIDLIEELVRICGYGRLPISLPRVSLRENVYSSRGLVSIVKNSLLGLGFTEAITHSLISRQLLAAFSIDPANSVEIKNPLNKEQEILRPTLLPSLARCVAYNLNQRQPYVNIFEVAKVFNVNFSGPVQEELSLGVGLCGNKPLLLGKGLVREEASLLHLKGIAETVFKNLGIKDYHFLATGTSEAGVYLGREKAGSIMKLSREILEQMDIKNKDVFMLELSLDKVFNCTRSEKRFIPLPKYPAIVRDVSFTFKEDIATKDVLKAMKESGGPLLGAVEITDYYKGKQIPDGYRGLTVSCLYRCAERTLTESEVNPLHESVCSLLKNNFGAALR